MCWFLSAWMHVQYHSVISQHISNAVFFTSVALAQCGTGCGSYDVGDAAAAAATLTSPVETLPGCSVNNMSTVKSTHAQRPATNDVRLFCILIFFDDERRITARLSAMWRHDINFRRKRRMRKTGKLLVKQTSPVALCSNALQEKW